VADVALPFEGVPGLWWIPLAVGLAVIVAMLAWTCVLFVRARHAWLHAPEPAPDAADAFTWVFLVPALNEEVTIADSVNRLLALELPRRRIVVIDDGSDDGTPEVLRQFADQPDLVVLRRDPPHAREGKAEALNYAYRMIDGMLGQVDRDEVIVAIVDADGRLHADAPRYTAAHFADPLVGGVQSLVRIYNRKAPLAWMQDVEFGVYGHLFQAGRNDWGTAGMGGNGQFNRLGALDQIADHRGPWRDRLTEDQDLGLRLLAVGWEGKQELRAIVDQQGLSKPRPLFRQRTRWSQGNLQAMGLTGDMWRARLPLSARIEVLAYLLMPFWQAIVGAAMVTAIVLWVTGTAPFIGSDAWVQLAFIYVLAFAGTMLGSIAAREDEGLRGWIKGFLIGHVYAVYTWFLWPVLLRSTVRQLTARDDWAKTEREPLEDAPALPSAG
jgi:1,2-diacylglycerol 3-beta-glucosyltransferase